MLGNSKICSIFIFGLLKFWSFYQNRSPNTWCQNSRNACQWRYHSRDCDKTGNPDLVVPKLTKRHPYHRRVYDKGPYHRRNYVNYLGETAVINGHGVGIRLSSNASKYRTNHPGSAWSTLLGRLCNKYAGLRKAVFPAHFDLRTRSRLEIKQGVR